MAGIRTAAGGPGGRRPPKAVDGTARALDERFGTTGFARRALRKAFPDQWSFLVGEIAMYSFVIILLTGVFLTLFFKPSMQEVVYDGSYTQLQGVEMSEAYASTLEDQLRCAGRAAHPADAPLGDAASSWRRSSSTCCATSSAARSASRGS